MTKVTLPYGGDSSIVVKVDFLKVEESLKWNWDQSNLSQVKEPGFKAFQSSDHLTIEAEEYSKN